MHRNIWLQSITKHSCPKWPCLFCDIGQLSLDNSSLQFEETVTSRSEHNHEAWDPEWIDYCFSAWATCSNQNCKQRYVISGSGNVQHIDLEDGDWDWIESFTPRHCYPMPDIFSISRRCPEKVSKALRDSFALFYADTNSCAGKIRCALERLMDHLNIPSFPDENTETRKRLSLHTRLEKFAVPEPQISNNLLAIKWLGNTAIHESASISKYDLLDAYEIIEHSLNEIIDQRTAKIAELAQKLKDKHSPKG